MNENNNKFRKRVSGAKIKRTVAARRHLLADKEKDMTANIPPKTTRKAQNGIDR